MTARDFANPLRKTHSLTFEPKRLFYPWHRWHGLELLTRKGSGPSSEHSLWCRHPEDPPDAAMVGIPIWMFDAAICATMRVGDQPSVDIAALRALQGLIGELRSNGSSEVLQHQSSQPENHGDADANDKIVPISNQPAGAVLRAETSAAVERLSRAVARGGHPKSGAAPAQRSRRKSKRSKRRSSKPRSAK